MVAPLVIDIFLPSNTFDNKIVKFESIGKCIVNDVIPLFMFQTMPFVIYTPEWPKRFILFIPQFEYKR